MASRGSRPRSLTWVHRAEQSVGDWERRHAAGEVPSAWPYGLDALADRVGVSVVDIPEASRLQRARGRLGMLRNGAADLAITWDENTAYRMQTVRPQQHLATGVIWLTDMMGAGAAPARLRAMLRRADALWVLSEAQLDLLRDLRGGPDERVFAIPFGIDADFFRPRPYPERPSIISVGNDRDRDTPTLYAALSLVLSARPDVRVVVQTSSTLVPPAGVRVIRQIPHVVLRDLYASASAVVVCTRLNLHASGVTVALEALATARPVVISDTPGMSRYVDDGRTGHLVTPGDADTVATVLLELLSDPDRAARMGAHGRSSVEALFTTQRTAGALIAGLCAAGALDPAAVSGSVGAS